MTRSVSSGRRGRCQGFVSMPSRRRRALLGGRGSRGGSWSISLGLRIRCFQGWCSRRLASSAITAGSPCPLISAWSISRPETPMMSEATEDNLIPASSSSFSIRWTSRPRSRVIAVRVRVRSRRCRIGSGGTNDPRTRPCAPSWASRVASETSSPNLKGVHFVVVWPVLVSLTTCFPIDGPSPGVRRGEGREIRKV